MEKNTVLLDVSEYNRLRDFKRGIEDGRFVYFDYYGDRVYHIERDEAIEGLTGKILRLEKELKDCKSPRPKKIGINDIKKMSYLQFRKWKKA